MPATPLLQKVEAIQVPVPDLDAGMGFYRDRLGHELRWRNDQIGQAGLVMPGSENLQGQDAVRFRRASSVRGSRLPIRRRRAFGSVVSVKPVLLAWLAD